MAKRRLSVEIVGDADRLDRAYKESADGADKFERKTSQAMDKSAKSAGGFGDELGKLKGKFSDWGQDLALGFGLGAGAIVGGLFVKGFSDAVDKEASTARLGIQLGLTPEMAKAAGQLAGEVYKSGFGESLDDANQAIRFIAQNMGGLGDITKDEMKDMTKGVLTLSDAFDEDLNQVTAAAGTLIKNGIARDGKEALDILTRGLQSPANKAGDLLDTFIEYSTQFRQLGLDGPAALGLLSQGLQGGARDADTVADALKEFVILGQEAIDPTSKAAVAFTILGLNATDMAHRIAEGGPQAQEALGMTLQAISAIEDPARRSQVEVALFGTKAEDLQGALGAMDTTTAVGQIGAVEGAMSNATAATDTNKAKVEEWKRSMEDNVTTWIAETGIPKLEEWWADWEHGTGLIGRFRDGCAKLGDGLRFLKDEVFDPLIGTMQKLWEWWDKLLDNSFINNIAEITSGPAQYFAQRDELPGFDNGGVVPGPRGRERLVMAHGGEAFLPLHKMGLEEALTSAFGERWVTYEDGSSSRQVLDGNGNWRNPDANPDKVADWWANQAAGANFAALGWPEEDVRAIADLIARGGAAQAQGAATYVFNGPVMGEQDFVQRIRSGNIQANRTGRGW